MAIFRRYYMLLYGLESYPRAYIRTDVTAASQETSGWRHSLKVCLRILNTNRQTCFLTGRGLRPNLQAIE